jgi:2-methylisocitrate lyase-like PEP mutase family enzyme
MPNPWDPGSARILESMGFAALATTSGGFAASLGRPDGTVGRDEALAHAASVVGAVGVPVSADLEHGFADDPATVAETVELATRTGLAGCSVEDASGDPRTPLYERSLAVDRVAAAAEAAHRGPLRLVLTARAETLGHGRDLQETIDRLQGYQEVGADVLFAPGLSALADIAMVVRNVDRPLSVLVGPGMPGVAALAEAGVARISVGSAFAWVAFGALAEAAAELAGPGTFAFSDRAAVGRRATTAAFFAS